MTTGTGARGALQQLRRSRGGAADVSAAVPGVHKQYLRLYVACYETMANAKRITSAVVRRMCFGYGSRLTDCP